MNEKTLNIKSRTQANSIAKAYINGSKYKLMAPERMIDICRQLINKVDRDLEAPLAAIIKELS
jgi:hypothetical protein